MSADPQQDPLAGLDSYAVGGRDANKAYARAQAQKRNLDPDFVDRLLTRESGYNPAAKSNQGAAGVGQLVTGTAKRYGVKNPYNAQESIDGALSYMETLRDKFHGDQRLMAAGYHSGEGDAAAALANPKGNPKTAAYAKAVGDGDALAGLDQFAVNAPARSTGVNITGGKPVTVNLGGGGEFRIPSGGFSQTAPQAISQAAVERKRHPVVPALPSWREGASQGLQKFVDENAGPKREVEQSPMPYLPGPLAGAPDWLKRGLVDLVTPAAEAVGEAIGGTASIPGQAYQWGRDVGRRMTLRQMIAAAAGVPELGGAPNPERSPELLPDFSGPGGNPIGQAGQELTAGAEQASQQYGLAPGLPKRIVRGIGAASPLLVARTPISLGALTTAESLGKGEPVGKSIARGMETAASIAAMGGGARALDETVTGASRAVGAARLAGRTAVNVTAPIASSAAFQPLTGDPVQGVTPESVAFGVAFGLMHHSRMQPRAEDGRFVEGAPVSKLRRAEQVPAEVGSEQGQTEGVGTTVSARLEIPDFNRPDNQGTAAEAPSVQHQPPSLTESRPPVYGAGNRVVTPDVAEATRARIKARQQPAATDSQQVERENEAGRTGQSGALPSYEDAAKARISAAERADIAVGRTPPERTAAAVGSEDNSVAEPARTKLDMLLDTVQPGQHEVTIDVRDYTPEQQQRMIDSAQARGLDASSDGRSVLVRDLRSAEPTQVPPKGEEGGNDPNIGRIMSGTDRSGRSGVAGRVIGRGVDDRYAVEVGAPEAGRSDIKYLENLQEPTAAGFEKAIAETGSVRDRPVRDAIQSRYDEWKATQGKPAAAETQSVSEGAEQTASPEPTSTPAKTVGRSAEIDDKIKSKTEYGASNKFVTSDAAAEALDRIKTRRGTKDPSRKDFGSGGPSTEELADWLTLATYHVEAGSRSVTDFASRMIEDIGDAVRPHLDNLHQRAMDVIDKTTASGTKLSGLKNAATEAERDALGLSEVERVAKRDYGARYDNATRVTPGMVEQWAKGHQSLSPEDVSGMIKYKTDLTNRHTEAARRLIAAREMNDELGMVAAMADLREAEDARNQYHEAAVNTGYEWGLSGKLRQEMMKQDYSLASVSQRVRAAQGGEAISDAQRKRLEGVTTRLTETLAELDKANERIGTQAAEMEVKRLARDVEYKSRQGKRAVTKEALATEFSDLTAQFAKVASKSLGGNLSANPLFDPEVYSLIGKMARNRTAAGVNTVSGLVDAIHETIKDHFEDLSKRDVMDAISGYGAPPKPSRAVLQSELAKLKTDMRKAAKTEDLAAGKTPATDRAALKGLKARIQTRIDEIQRRLDEQDYTKPERRTVPLDQEAKNLQAKAGRLQSQLDTEVRKAELANRGPVQKVADFIVKARRAMALSASTVVGKIGMASTMRIGGEPVEQGVSTVIGKVPGISRAAKMSPMYGGISARAEGEALSHTFSKETLKAMKDTAKTGRSDLDVLYGNKNQISDPEWIELFGRMHAALKTPAKINTFYRSLSRYADFETRQAIKRGMTADEATAHVNAPDMQAVIAGKAYEQANRNIFMNDNWLSRNFSMLMRSAHNAGEEGSVQRAAGRAVEFAGRMVLPVTRVAPNYAAEATSYAIGGAKAGAQAAMIGSRQLRGKILGKAVEGIKPEEADYIMRNLTKQTVGLGLMAVGFLNADKIGGYYQPGDEKDKAKVPTGGAKMFGIEVPRFLLHTPALEMLQIGATIKHVIDKRTKKGKGEAVAAGAFEAGKGLFYEVPFFDVPQRAVKGLESYEGFKKYAGKQMGGIITPPDLARIARATDESDKRYPKGFWDEIKVGIPGARQTVPLAKRAGGFISP